MRNRPLSICTRFDMDVFLEGFLAPSFDFPVIYGSTIGAGDSEGLNGGTSITLNT